LTDRAAAELIHKDQLDILVDLAGHTGGNRLPIFGYRPAPVQATWLGYPNTTGVRQIDYRLTDGIADPESADAIHSEQLVRLGNGFLCYRPDVDSPDLVNAPYDASGFLTFGSFNNITKVTPSVLDSWANVLKAYPDSRLFLKSKLLQDGGVSGEITSAFAKRGVDANRLEIAGRTETFHDHLADYGRVDIALDTFPYNGTTTTCEALWMGVPVVVPEGATHRSRVSQSILARVGLEQCVAPHATQLTDAINHLLAQPAGLSAFRTEIRERMRRSPLCQPTQFAQEMQAAFRRMQAS